MSERRAGGRASLAALADRARADAETLRALGSDALRREAQASARELRRHGFADAGVGRALALACEAARRAVGLEPYDVQIRAGAAMLRGALVELETGEGKTLAAALPAAAAALAGLPVHVLTANDYLVERDAALLAPLYAALGLTVGIVTEAMREPDARRAAWACDVTYATGRQVAFDHLRDRLRAGPRGEGAVLRGLGVAVVDEADALLVDEARTPLVLAEAAAGPAAPSLEASVLALAAALAPGRDFELEPHAGGVELTPEGRARLAVAAALGGELASEKRRVELVERALVARHLLRRDEHYVVRGGRVEIVDPHTGRAMPERSWEQGLHQMVEAKEGCAASAAQRTVARITVQRFFRRYRHLCGMTGTAREVAREVRRVYGLRTVRLPPRLPVRRTRLPDRVFPTTAERWDAVVARVRALHAVGRPVLVGTQSVASSMHLSQRLVAAGLPHALLNALEDGAETEVLAHAGAPGRITVATNMAGRGADVLLAPGVAELGGLHVIVAERGDARRIDRQLVGRCARQGQPGSCEHMASLEDALVARHAPRGLRRELARLLARDTAWTADGARWLACRLVDHAQRAEERRHARLRHDLLGLEEELDRALAFAGTRE